jgi:hypothetical protein
VGAAHASLASEGAAQGAREAPERVRFTRSPPGSSAMMPIVITIALLTELFARASSASLSETRTAATRSERTPRSVETCFIMILKLPVARDLSVVAT